MNENPKTLLAIDPGYDRCGVAVFTLGTKNPELLYSTCILTKKTESQERRLLFVFETLERLIKEWSIRSIALETLFFSINKKTALKVAEARGALLLLVAKHNLELVELSPQEVKLSVTGVGNAGKPQVQKMVNLLFKGKLNGKIDDEIDAIALGIGASTKLLFSQKIKS